MPFLTQNQYENLLRAGNMMSNLCYNLSQKGSGSTLNDDLIESMDESYKFWDETRLSIQKKLNEKTDRA